MERSQARYASQAPKKREPGTEKKREPGTLCEPGTEKKRVPDSRRVSGSLF